MGRVAFLILEGVCTTTGRASVTRMIFRRKLRIVIWHGVNDFQSH
jgi:hypothetical protein